MHAVVARSCVMVHVLAIWVRTAARRLVEVGGSHYSRVSRSMMVSMSAWVVRGFTKQKR